jgi:hypothetical protein
MPKKRSSVETVAASVPARRRRRSPAQVPTTLVAKAVATQVVATPCIPSAFPTRRENASASTAVSVTNTAA